MRRELGVWLNGIRVGVWQVRPGAPDRLEYEPAWIASAIGRPLSLSLPYPPPGATLSGENVRGWFENLLPDSDAIRERIGRRFGVRANDTIGLLAEVGRDCVGAVQLLPVDAPPPDVRQITGTPLSQADVGALLRRTPLPASLAGNSREELRISIAGAQEKTALLRHNGVWMRPTAATPTTHILKLPLGRVSAVGADFSLSVENEWVCLRLLAALGLPVARAEIGHFPDHAGDTPITALIVERFDRALRGMGTPDAWIARLPQEDCCQATGTPAARKYEDQGGPGIERISALLAGSVAPDVDRRTFLLAQLACWLLAAPDGHAKNYSIALQAGGAYRLTPLYDVMSAWPIVGSGARQWSARRVTLAMGVRGTHRRLRRGLREIHPVHWYRLATSSGVERMFDAMVAMVEAVPAALDAVAADLPDAFPRGDVFEPIRDGMLGQCARVLRSLPHVGRTGDSSSNSARD